MAYWLRRCTTSRTVPGSLPGGVTGFFSDIFLPNVPFLGSTCYATSRTVPGSIPGDVSLDFSVRYSFRPYHGLGVGSAPSENKYQEYFLGVKVAGA